MLNPLNRRKPAKARVVLTDEKVLERINACAAKSSPTHHCRCPGDQRKDLIEWASYDNDTVGPWRITLWQRWTITKALAYESKAVNEETPLGKLCLLAMARGGRLIRRHGEFKVSIIHEPNTA
jgi:hypothetical protein